MAPVTRDLQQATSKPDQRAKVTLYWLDKSRSQRVLWLLEELKVDYELKIFKRQNMLAPPELTKIHPLGKSPVVTVESEASPKPLVLAESGYIFEYLIDHFGSWLAPERYQKGKDGMVCGETEEWTRYRYYMHYAEGTLMPYLVTWLLFSTMKKQSPFFIRPIVSMLAGAVESNFLLPNLKANWAFLESQLATSPNNGEYLCGAQLTGADIMVSFPVGAAKDKLGFTKEAYPRLWAWVEKCERTDGYKKSVQKIIDVEGYYEPVSKM